MGVIAMNRLYRFLFSRVSFAWQVGGVCVVLAGIEIAGVVLFFRPGQTWVQVSDVLLFVFFLQVFVGVLVLWVFRVFMYRINKVLRQVLQERGLAHELHRFYEAEDLPQLLGNVQGLFALFKAFDHMKATKIGVETQSLKAIVNNIEEGVMVLNKDRVVTHINHTAENMLRLLPGEIVGQTVSRKVSSPEMLSCIERTLSEDHKFLQVVCCIREGIPLSLDTYPIKDAFGEVVRVVAILRQK